MTLALQAMADALALIQGAHVLYLVSPAAWTYGQQLLLFR